MNIDKNKKHNAEERKIMDEYFESVDIDILRYVQDVENGVEVQPLIIGTVSFEMAETVRKITGVDIEGNETELNKDAVRHILKRHGREGKADHTMADIRDIARMGYVMNNYDFVLWDGVISEHYRLGNGQKAPQIVIGKRVDGVYYIVEAVSDSKRRRNIITSVYLKKAEE